MDDIEGGQRRPGPGAPDGAADRRSPTGSWLGSILNRPRSAPNPDDLEARQHSRFSAVPEESSQHTRPASSTGTDDPFAGLYASSASSSQQQQQQQQQQGRHRKGGLNRQADNPEHLYSSSYTRPHTAFTDGSSREGGGALDSSSAASAAAGSSKGQQQQQQQQRWSSPNGLGSDAPQVNAMGDVLVGRMSMQVKVSEGAKRKFIHMVQEEDVSAQIESSKRWGSRGVIHPLDRRYRAWWYLTVGAAAFTGWLTTYRLAFVPNAGYRDLRTSPDPSGASVLESILLAVFLADIVVSFFVGYYDESGLLVLDNRRVATHYLRRRFLLDILTTLPWDEVVMTATGIHGDTHEGRYIALLSLLKLGRMYRLVVMFYNISYNLSVGLLTLTLLRNFTFCFFLLHWAACGFWFVALQEGLHTNKKTWVSQQSEMLDGSTTVELYIFSFYWSLVTFATLGYGDVTPHTTAEVVFTIVYVAFNIVVWAYVLGTITLLVTKQDTELGVYRERMQSLTSYCNANNLPHELKQTMAGLLRLHMSLQNEAQGDEQVLGIFPTTIRRRILRQLYSNSLQGCYLFKDTGVKFLDALMLGARVELFLPKVEIVSALDHANELYIVVAGYVEVVDPTLVGKTAEMMREGERDDNEQQQQQQQQQQQLLDPGVENAFTAGMVTPQQLQHAATIGQHPAATLPTPSRLMPLIEGQQHHDTPNPLHPVPGTNPKQQPYSRTMSGPQGSPRLAQLPAKTAFPAKKGGLLQRLPGGRRLAVWMESGRKDSWRKQQEQLQKDKYDINQVPYKALAKHSRTLGTHSAFSDPGTGTGSSGRQYNDHTIPAFAMRNLQSSSKLPRLAHSSGGSSKGVGAQSSGTQAAGDQVPPELGATPGRVQLGPGDCFAEVAYFTEVPKAEAVRSLTICRVLVIPRSTYNAVARDFPLSARQVLENLKKRAQQLVEEFLPRDLARELMRGADAQNGGTAAAAGDSSGEGYVETAQGYAAAAAAAGERQGDRAAYKHLSPFSSSDVQRAGDVADAAVAAVEAEDRFQQQQQQGAESAGTSRPRSPLAPRSSAPPTSFGSAAATAAAMRRLTPAAVAAAAAAAAARQSTSGGGGAAAARKERPLLSSMSVNLSGRYSTPGGRGNAGGPNPRKSLEMGRLHSRSSEAAMFRRKSVDAADLGGIGDRSGATSPRSTTSADPTTVDDRAARALARFTVSVNPRVRGAPSAATDAELIARAGESAPAFVRSSTMTHETTGQPLSPVQQHKQRADSEAQRMLTTMSLLPQGTMRHAAMARAWEGLPQQQQQQQTQQQQQHSLSIIASPSGDVDPSALQNQTAAAAAGENGGKQWSPALIKSAGLGYEEGSRIYSDEEVQAVAAALPAPLTLQQQRLLADLLRLKRLVNKAAAKYDQMQLTSFLDAAANGDVDVVQDMLRQGMNPNTCDYDGRTALMIAAYKGHKDVVLALLFAGADTSPKDARGFDVMIEGARGNREDIIDVLKRSGARTGISIMLQAALLCKATYEGKMDRLALLLRAGCEADAHDYDGQTALHVAAAEGSLAAARVLIQAGASLTIKDRWGYNPLDVAYKVGAAPLVEYLSTQAAPDVSAAAAEGWKRERTEAALAAARYGDTAALSRLLDRGCPVDASDYDGRSLLHVAVHNKQEAVLRQLLAAGADPNVRSSSGSSPLLEAAMDGSTAIQSELMSAGARLGMPATEEAALLSSVLHAHRHDQLLALLTAGADPAAADYDSRTPLHIAGSLGDVGALQLMADALADSGIERLTNVNWQATDRWGDTPLQEAQRAGHADAAAFLQKQITDQHKQQQQQQQQKAAVAASK